MKAEGKVGTQTYSDGAGAELRIDRTGAMVTDPHGAYYEAAKRGLIYNATTAVAGVDHGATLDTAAPFALQSPTDSGVDLVILRVVVVYVSGTLGAGFLAYADGPPHTTAVTGTTITPRSGRSSSAGGRGVAWTTVTLPATPTLRGVVGSSWAVAAATAAAPSVLLDEVRGRIVVAPGWSLSIQGVMGAAGTVPLVVFDVTWAEVPV